MLEKHILKK